MRILHVYAGPYPTAQGTQVLVGQTATLLAERGHEVHLLCYSHGDTHGQTEQPSGFPIHRIPNVLGFNSVRSGLHAKKLALDLSLSLKTAELTKTLEPDLIHAHHYEALAAAALADPLRKRPKVFHAHALFGPELPTYVTRPLKPILGVAGRFIDKHLPSFADGIIAVSAEMKQTLQAKIDRSTPMIVALPPFERPPELTEKQNRYDGGPVQMIYTGNLDEYQGMENLLRGLGQLDSKTRARLSARILTNSDPTHLKKKILDYDLGESVDICPLGSWVNTYAKMQAADFMVVPRTLQNGFPIKMVNALIAGCPLLTDYRLAKELRHEKEIYKIDMGDPHEVATGIARLTADAELRYRLGLGGQAAALRLHDPQKITLLIEDFYREILSRRTKKNRPLA